MPDQLLYPLCITLQNEYFEAFVLSQVVMNLRTYDVLKFVLYFCYGIFHFLRMYEQ
jgi:hypothetical protein